MIIVVIGGCGFVGTSLARELLHEGATVHIFDREPPPSSLLNISTGGGIRYHRGSVTDYNKMVSLFLSIKPDVVIHLASYGMSGGPMLQKGTCNHVNVLGVGLLLAAMKVGQVVHLVYVSTYNVVYGGEKIENGDESMEHYPLEGHTDFYGPSKAMAENAVISANGMNGMKTCVIRPAAIYGEGEQRHFPRIVSHIDRGIFKFRIGTESIVDWVHVENLTQSLLLAVEGLTSKGKGSAPCGQCYFISDGTPLDNFEFLRPLLEVRGEAFPSIVLPVPFALAIGWVCEVVYKCSSAIGLPIEPFLTRAEVYKVGKSHYFSIDKAERDLGYSPTINSTDGAKIMAREYALCGAKGENTRFFRIVSPVWYLPILGGMFACYCVAFTTPSQWQAVGPVYATIMQALLKVGLLLFQTQFMLRMVFIAAVAAHALEAFYAYRVCITIECSSTCVLWILQTFVFGFPSLRMLLARRDLYLHLKEKRQVSCEGHTKSTRVYDGPWWGRR